MPINSSKKQNVPVGRRKENRFSLSNTQLTLTQSKFLGLRKQEYKAALVNISKKGIQVLSKVPLDPGVFYNINFFVPGANVSFTMKAKVIWNKFLKREKNRDYYRVGLKFNKLKPDVEKELIKLIPV